MNALSRWKIVLALIATFLAGVVTRGLLTSPRNESLKVDEAKLNGNRAKFEMRFFSESAGLVLHSFLRCKLAPWFRMMRAEYEH